MRSRLLAPPLFIWFGCVLFGLGQEPTRREKQIVRMVLEPARARAFLEMLAERDLVFSGDDAPVDSMKKRRYGGISHKMRKASPKLASLLCPQPLGIRVRGAWNGEGASVRITILPLPRRTWWVFVFYSLALFFLVLGYLRYHRKTRIYQHSVMGRLCERTVPH